MFLNGLVVALCVIPLILYTSQYKMNGDNMLNELLELLCVSVIFIGVLGLTYWVTKKIGNMNKHMSLNKNMQIIELLPLMQGQYLYIVKIGLEYHLIGCSQKGEITYLKAIDESQLKLEEVKNKSFQEHFIQFVKGKQVSKDENKE